MNNLRAIALNGAILEHLAQRRKRKAIRKFDSAA
jgi:hypothetical protein